MNPETVLSLSAPARFQLEVVEACTSTNDVLKARAGALSDPYVLIACRQTGGKGRMGRSFFSPDGTGLYMSVLLRPELPARDLPLLTPAAAVAVCQAIREDLGVEAGIKWVNDILVDGKKVCGILTESALTPGGDVSHAVVGIGVNVSPPEGGWPEEISATAGSVLPRFTPGAREKLAAGILRRYLTLLPRIKTLEFSEDYRSMLLYMGRGVELIRGGESRAATVLGSDRRCALLVRLPDGRREAVSSGEITLRLKEDDT